MLVAIFGHANPFKGGNKGCAKGEGKGKFDPNLRMVSKTIGQGQSRVYKQNVLTTRNAQRMLDGIREESAQMAAAPSAAPAVAASSSSGPDVAAAWRQQSGACRPSGPGGAVGASSGSVSAVTQAPTSAGIDWASHFSSESPENRPKGPQTPAQEPEGEPIGSDQVPGQGKGKTLPSYSPPAAVSAANWWAATSDWQPPAWNQWAHETPWRENWQSSTFMTGSYTTAHPHSAWHPQTGRGADPNSPWATSSSSFGAGKGSGWRPSSTPYGAPKGTKGKGQTPPWVQGWSGNWKGSKGSKK
jgi:hypothetical protein